MDTESTLIEKPSGNQPEKTKYKLYKWRWMVLLSYCAISLANAPVSTAFPAVSNILQKYYGVDAIYIHSLLGIFAVTMIFFLFPFSYILHKYELGCVLKIAATLNLIGGVIRFFGETKENGFWFLLIGNFFCSISMAGYMFLPPKIGQNWFGDNEQGRVNGICIGFDMIATAFGFIHSTHVVLKRDTDRDTRVDIKKLLLHQLIAAGVATLITWAFSQSHPKTPPSEREERRLAVNANKVNALLKTDEKCDIEIKSMRKNNEESLWRYVKLLLTHKDYLLIVHMGSITLAVEILFEMVLNDMLAPKFPGKEKAIGVIGFVAIILGFFSNIIIGYFIDKTRIYKRTTILTYLLAVLCLMAWTLLLEFYHSFELLALSFCLFVLINTSYYATSTTHMVVATQPIPPGSSSMILLTITAFYGTLISFGGSFIMKHTSTLFVNILSLALIFNAFIMSFFLSNDHREGATDDQVAHV